MWGLLWGNEKLLKVERAYELHSIINTQNSTESSTLEWLIACYVNFTCQQYGEELREAGKDRPFLKGTRQRLPSGLWAGGLWLQVKKVKTGLVSFPGPMVVSETPNQCLGILSLSAATGHQGDQIQL